MSETKINLSNQEAARILGGLRLLQYFVENNLRTKQDFSGFPPGIEDVITDLGAFDFPTPQEIDRLCDKVNYSGAFFMDEDENEDEDESEV